MSVSLTCSRLDARFAGAPSLGEQVILSVCLELLMTMTPLEYEQSKAIEARIKKWLPTLPEWERLQLTFDILAALKKVAIREVESNE